LPEPSPGYPAPATSTGTTVCFCPGFAGTGFCPGQWAGIHHRPVSWKQDKPEPVVPVPVAGRVPVAIRRAAVPGVVVPTAAPKHAVRASGQNPKSEHHISP